MKRIFKLSIWLGLSLLLGASLTSCESYLDKEPDSTVSEAAAFKDFRSFQGFIEEIYNCIPDKEKCNWCPSWNWGDDEIFNPEADNRMTHQADLGNFRAWMQTGNWLYKSGSNPTAKDKFAHSLWPHSWYCIRKANVGLQALEEGKLVAATEEERNLLAGQLYFFRAWWHFELICWFDGLPYIDKAFEANDELNLARPSFQETAERCAEDFAKAAELLPIDWETTAPGKLTAGKNQLRINKIMALSYLGKCYLWAASPLMEHGPQIGGANTYNYNKDYAKRAADAFAQVLNLVESGQTQYALAEYKFDDIYNHKASPDASSRFSDLFYTRGQNWLMPGTVEAIFRGPSHDFNGSNWNTTKVFGPKVAGLVDHDNVIHQPTANAVNMYGMANGLRLDDQNGEGAFDKNYPFKDRDPRFYHDIVFDGFKYVHGELSSDREQYRYCELFTGGNMRPVANASRTGYFIQKLVPHTCNMADREYDWGFAMHTYLPYMRLADIYLMYAEATAVLGGPNGKVDGCSLTSVDAINRLRDRVGMAHVHENYLVNDQIYMDEVRRERAVELMFEGFRFNDLQRWLLLTEAPYTQKYSQEFDRVHDADWYKKNDPRDAQVANFREELILERVFGTKHYWFPLPDDEVYLYEDFPQNPGW
ncbi:MAG: RagB/SusD family nutrient uptake outer membrane protein [Bacteroidales bacterium]|nr:RagB/SusD family nutrient uptake outer membrane protein [Bacteroidales bacterium]